MAIRIVAAEDSFLIREGLRMLLDTQDDLDLVTSVTNLQDLLEAANRQEPDVVVTDIRMPPGNQDEGIQAAESLAESHPEIGVVVLSQYVEPDWAMRLFTPVAARRAYLHKERIGDLAHLRHAIESVAGGGSALDSLVVEALVEARTRKADSPISRLTRRETEVLELMASGLSNAAIANALVLTERAIEKHVTAILTKLDLDPDDADVHRRVRAVLLYLSATTD